MKLITLFTIMLCITNANAREVFGKWGVTEPIKGVLIANTENNSNEVSGVICLKDSCSAYIKIANTCTINDVIPSLVSSSAGSHYVTFTCKKIEDILILVANEFETMISVYESGGIFGIAIALDTGEFKVSRFSANGAIPAIRRASKNASDKNDKSSEYL